MDVGEEYWKRKVFRVYWNQINLIKERKAKIISKAALLEIAKEKYKESIMQEMLYLWI